jgi:hypothetical protein
MWLAGFKCQAQRHALPQQVLLANDLTQILGAQAFGKGRGGDGTGVVHNGAKKACPSLNVKTVFQWPHPN